MSSPGTLDRLPIIDIAPFLNNHPEDGEERAFMVSALHSACVEYGFFYLNIEAYVDPSEPAELAQLGRQFFHLPQDEKNKLSLENQDFARGYARLNQNVTNESQTITKDWISLGPLRIKTKLLWGENQWPTVPGFKEKYEIWAEKMKALGLIVMEAISMGLGMTQEEWQDLRSQVDDSFWGMRVIGISCGAHKDYGCLTFLYADPTPSALQVLLRRPGALQADKDNGLSAEESLDEGIWISADPIPGCVVCDIGEMWEIWTDGLYHSTLHRVIHKGSNYRISLPFFFEPNFEAVVKPLPAVFRIKEMEDAEELKTVRKPVVYGDFLISKVGNNFAIEIKGKYNSD